MAELSAFEVVKIPGLKETDKGLAFLRRNGQPEIDAQVVYDGLKPKSQEDMRHRFDHWLEGNHFDKYFHGFPTDPVYHDLWTFKWQQGRSQQHRLYGFLTHPRLSDRSFQACILVCHGTKIGGSRHDPAKLALTESLRLNPEVIKRAQEKFSRR